MFDEAGDRGLRPDASCRGGSAVRLHCFLGGLDQCLDGGLAHLRSAEQGLRGLVGEVGPPGKLLRIGAETPRKARVRDGQGSDLVEARDKFPQRCVLRFVSRT
jgi:hypothetical protein